MSDTATQQTVVAQTAAPLTKDDLLARLAGLGIAVEAVGHPPVHTVAEALPYWSSLAGIHTKNLFLKDAKDQLWLVAAPADLPTDMKQLAARIGAKRLSFAKEELLYAALGVRQGAVSPLAVVNDTAGRVILVLDEALAKADKVTFHPLTNEATVSMAPADLMRFLADCGHEPRVVALAGSTESVPAA